MGFDVIGRLLGQPAEQSKKPVEVKTVPVEAVIEDVTLIEPKMLLETAAEDIGLAPEELAKALGASESVVKNLLEAENITDPRAEDFLKFSFALRNFMNDDKKLMRDWLRSENMSFEAPPIKVMVRKNGLSLLRRYLEMVVARRDADAVEAFLKSRHQENAA